MLITCILTSLSVYHMYSLSSAIKVKQLKGKEYFPGRNSMTHLAIR